jgi:hypothetical protein
LAILPDTIESEAWLARRPDIAVARAELKPILLPAFDHVTLVSLEDRSTQHVQ